MIWSVETEKIAIENSRNGDPNAFQMLYENYSRYVYRRCLRFTHDPATAEDLSQDVFIQVWRKISSFRGDSTFKTWLHRIATNVVFMHLRNNRRHPPPEQYDLWARDGRYVEERFPSSPPRLDDCLLLHQVVSTLSPGHRTALILHDVAGYKHREIAQILSIPSGTSKSNLYRARQRIRATFKIPHTGPLTAEQNAA
jgi:RNA polymerase sigma-70 factor (ECF subfamily)